jgi:nucleoside-diphosphate-sugar epimerase
MHVVVTGATGFLGSAIVRHFIAHGAQVAAVMRPRADPWRLADVIHSVVQFRVSSFDDSSLRRHFAYFQPDVLIHAAWHGVGNRDRDDPLQIERNVVPSCTLVDMAAEAGCQTFIGFGSQAEYGPVNTRCDETMLPRPTTLYGAAKVATYYLTQRLAQQRGMRFAWLRIFSTYGPRDNPEWLIPYVIREFLARRKPSLTACEQRWDYLYVDDAARAAHEVAINPKADGAFNLGSGVSVPLRAIVERVRDLVDPSLPIGFGEVMYRPDQVMHLEADINRLNAIGWKPVVPLDEGLACCVALQRTHGTIQQISP